MKMKFVKNNKYYTGFFWSVISFICLSFKDSRPVAILAIICSLVHCTYYLCTRKERIALSIIGIIINVFALFLYIGYYSYKIKEQIGIC